MGTVVVSLDAELAWGFHDQDSPPAERIASARWGWQRALELFDTYRVPATWAVVGHLYLDSCDGRHADHPAPPGWFDRDPGGAVARDPTWYGPDLVRAIDGAAVDHEVASHTFSHVEFGDRGTTTELAAAELERARAVAAAVHEPPTTVVFPRNEVGHLDVLAEKGITCYRGRKPPEWFDGQSYRALGKTLATVAGRPPPVVRPSVDERGLVNLPASLYLYGFETWLGEASRTHPLVRRARAGVDAAAATGGVCHLWLHPNNLRTERHADRLAAVLEYVTTCRDRGEVSVQTMGAVAARARGGERAPQAGH